MAGPAAARATIKPLVLGVMGRSIIDCGEEVGQASLLKIAGNVVVIGLMEVVSEVLVFAEKVGLGTEVVQGLVGDMFGAVAGSYAKRYVFFISLPSCPACLSYRRRGMNSLLMLVNGVA